MITANAIVIIANVFQIIIGRNLQNEVLVSPLNRSVELRQLILTTLRYSVLKTTSLIRPTISQSFDANPEASSQFCDDIQSDTGISNASVLTAVCLVGVPRSMTRLEVQRGLQRFLSGWGLRNIKLFAVLSAPNKDEVAEFDFGHLFANESDVESLLHSSE